MRNVCIIGNSHAAALKLYLNKISNSKFNSLSNNVSFKIFGCPDGEGDLSSFIYRKNYTLKNNILSPNSDIVQNYFEMTSGAHSINLNEFTDIIFYFGNNVLDIRHYIHPFRFNIPSNSIIKLILEAILAKYSNGIMREIIIQNKKLPLLHIMMNPLPSSEAKHYSHYAKAPVHQYSIKTVNYIRKNIDLKETFPNFIVHLQPLKTIDVTKISTKNQFSKNSKRLTMNLNVNHHVNDFDHMNLDYGKIIINEFVDWAINHPLK